MEKEELYREHCQRISEAFHKAMPQEGKVYHLNVVQFGKKKKERFFHKRGFIYVMFKGSKTKGTFANIGSYESVESPKETDAKTYRKRFVKAYKMLETSGLWTKFIAPLKEIADMDEETFSELSAIARGLTSNLYNEVHKGGKFAHLHVLGSSIIESLFSNKPFKTPNWYSWDEHTKNNVKNAINERKELIERWCKGYDNSIHVGMDEEGLKAWYSEEYRGCGNGHYYLLFDPTHAIFIEND